MNVRKPSVIIPADMQSRPKPHEESAAAILSKHFQSDVIFLEASSSGGPDVAICGTAWEIKSPIGNSDNNIQKTMREASHQSNNIVIDLRRSKLHQSRALGYIRQYLNRPSYLKKVLVIAKSQKVLAIK
jgi:hypothetical protein